MFFLVCRHAQHACGSFAWFTARIVRRLKNQPQVDFFTFSPGGANHAPQAIESRPLIIIIIIFIIIIIIMK